MPIIPVADCRSAIIALYNNCIAPLTAQYPLIIVDNLANTDNPRIRLSYKTYLCIITYGEYNTPLYSMNWYANEKKKMPEFSSPKVDTIAHQLELDAETFFT